MAFFQIIEIDGSSIKIISECSEADTCKKIKLDDTKSNLIKNDLLNGNDIYIINGKISVSGKNDHFINKTNNKILAEKILKEKYLNLTKTSLVDLVFYTDALMELADAGYFITDKNREDKYIEIIETGKEDLIDLLEEYLLHKDQITAIKWQRKEFNKHLKKLKSLEEDSAELKEFMRNI